MGEKGTSRRSFLRSTAISSAGAALASLPVANAAAPGAPPALPWPVTVESYPRTDPALPIRQSRIKLVTAGNGLTSAMQKKLRAYAPNLEITAGVNYLNPLKVFSRLDS